MAYIYIFSTHICVLYWLHGILSTISLLYYYGGFIVYRQHASFCQHMEYVFIDLLSSYRFTVLFLCYL